MCKKKVKMLVIHYTNTQLIKHSIAVLGIKTTPHSTIFTLFFGLFKNTSRYQYRVFAGGHNSLRTTTDLLDRSDNSEYTLYITTNLNSKYVQISKLMILQVTTLTQVVIHTLNMKMLKLRSLLLSLL